MSSARARRRTVARRLVAAAWIALAPVSLAATTRSFTASTAEELQRGTFEGTALDEDGWLRLAPEVTTVFGPERGIVWDIVPDGAGGVFVALSNPGRVVRVDARGASAVRHEPGEEALVTAVATDGSGGVFAGVSPTGDVLRLPRDPRDDAPIESWATEAKFVWALARDTQGSLWIGTGLPGRVLRLDAHGTLHAVFESGDDPIRSIAPLAGGGVMVGTGGRGRVIRIDEQGQAFVLFDADEPEIVALATGDAGVTWALASGGAKQVQPRGTSLSSEGPLRVVVTPSGEAPSIDAEPPPMLDREPERNEPRLSAPSGGSLYRIDSEGGARKTWSASGEAPFDLARLADGRLAIATGDSGAVHAVDPGGRTSRLLRIASDQASALAVGSPEPLWVGGSGNARLDRVGSEPRASGSYLTIPIDAGNLARWGRVRWDAETPRGAAVAVRVRTGNSADPDSTWSAWRTLEVAAAGEADAGGRTARFLQIALDLEGGRGASPVVRRIEASYTPRNRPPAVTSVGVEPAGVVWLLAPSQSSSLAGPFVADDPVARAAVERNQPRSRVSTTPPVRKAFEPGARTFVWSAEDPDGDRLRYAVEVRREGATDWLPLATELTDPFYSWDARSLPDGAWRGRVRTDDGRDNPKGEELAAERVSEVFRIDNTRPGVDEFAVRRTGPASELSFQARDPGGSVAACEIAFDGGPWRALDPEDGIADAERERYRVALPDAPAPRAVRVRVIDGVGNVGGDVWLVGPAP